jgi:hypothetical protein
MILWSHVFVSHLEFHNGDNLRLGTLPREKPMSLECFFGFLALNRSKNLIFQL